MNKEHFLKDERNLTLQNNFSPPYSFFADK
jgi:hypothetical protein